MTAERKRLLRRLVPALLALGAVLLVSFEATITLFLGVVFLLSAVALGVAAIAEPDFLEADAPAPPAPEASTTVAGTARTG